MMIFKVFFLGVLLAGPALADRSIEGRVTVVRDVDTIVVAGTPVRLNGVDGPETSTRIGRDARAFMTRLVRGETVSCDLSGERTYDRWVGVCYLGDQVPRDRHCERSCAGLSALLGRPIPRPGNPCGSISDPTCRVLLG